MTRSQAMTIIKDAVTNGKVLVCTHAKERMVERDVEMTDILCVLKNGKILKPPEPNIKTGNLRWRVEGSTIDNKFLKIVVEIEDNGIVVVTVF